MHTPIHTYVTLHFADAAPSAQVLEKLETFKRGLLNHLSAKHTILLYALREQHLQIELPLDEVVGEEELLRYSKSRIEAALNNYLQELKKGVKRVADNHFEKIVALAKDNAFDKHYRELATELSHKQAQELSEALTNSQFAAFLSSWFPEEAKWFEQVKVLARTPFIASSSYQQSSKLKLFISQRLGYFKKGKKLHDLYTEYLTKVSDEYQITLFELLQILNTEGKVPQGLSNYFKGEVRRLRLLQAKKSIDALKTFKDLQKPEQLPNQAHWDELEYVLKSPFEYEQLTHIFSGLKSKESQRILSYWWKDAVLSDSGRVLLEEFNRSLKPKTKELSKNFRIKKSKSLPQRKANSNLNYHQTLLLRWINDPGLVAKMIFLEEIANLVQFEEYRTYVLEELNKRTGKDIVRHFELGARSGMAKYKAYNLLLQEQLGRFKEEEDKEFIAGLKAFEKHLSVRTFIEEERAEKPLDRQASTVVLNTPASAPSPIEEKLPEPKPEVQTEPEPELETEPDPIIVPLAEEEENEETLALAALNELDDLLGDIQCSEQRVHQWFQTQPKALELVQAEALRSPRRWRLGEVCSLSMLMELGLADPFQANSFELLKSINLRFGTNKKPVVLRVKKIIFFEQIKQVDELIIKGFHLFDITSITQDQWDWFTNSLEGEFENEFNQAVFDFKVPESFDKKTKSTLSNELDSQDSHSPEVTDSFDITVQNRKYSSQLKTSSKRQKEDDANAGIDNDNNDQQDVENRFDEGLSYQNSAGISVKANTQDFDEAEKEDGKTLETRPIDDLEIEPSEVEQIDPEVKSNQITDDFSSVLKETEKPVEKPTLVKEKPKVESSLIPEESTTPLPTKHALVTEFIQKERALFQSPIFITSWLIQFFNEGKAPEWNLTFFNHQEALAAYHKLNQEEQLMVNRALRRSFQSRPDLLKQIIAYTANFNTAGTQNKWIEKWPAPLVENGLPLQSKIQFEQFASNCQELSSLIALKNEEEKEFNEKTKHLLQSLWEIHLEQPHDLKTIHAEFHQLFNSWWMGIREQSWFAQKTSRQIRSLLCIDFSAWLQNQISAKPIPTNIIKEAFPLWNELDGSKTVTIEIVQKQVAHWKAYSDQIIEDWRGEGAFRDVDENNDVVQSTALQLAFSEVLTTSYVECSQNHSIKSFNAYEKNLFELAFSHLTQLDHHEAEIVVAFVEHLKNKGIKQIFEEVELFVHQFTSLYGLRQAVYRNEAPALFNKKKDVPFEESRTTTGFFEIHTMPSLTQSAFLSFAFKLRMDEITASLKPSRHYIAEVANYHWSYTSQTEDDAPDHFIYYFNKAYLTGQAFLSVIHEDAFQPLLENCLTNATYTRELLHSTSNSPNFLVDFVLSSLRLNAQSTANELDFFGAAPAHSIAKFAKHIEEPEKNAAIELDSSYYERSNNFAQELQVFLKEANIAITDDPILLQEALADYPAAFQLATQKVALTVTKHSGNKKARNKEKAASANLSKFTNALLTIEKQDATERFDSIQSFASYHSRKEVQELFPNQLDNPAIQYELNQLYHEGQTSPIDFEVACSLHRLEPEVPFYLLSLKSTSLLKEYFASNNQDIRGFTACLDHLQAFAQNWKTCTQFQLKYISSERFQNATINNTVEQLLGNLEEIQKNDSFDFGISPALEMHVSKNFPQTLGKSYLANAGFALLLPYISELQETLRKHYAKKSNSEIRDQIFALFKQLENRGPSPKNTNPQFSISAELSGSLEKLEDLPITSVDEEIFNSWLNQSLALCFSKEIELKDALELFIYRPGIVWSQESNTYVFIPTLPDDRFYSGPSLHGKTYQKNNEKGQLIIVWYPN